MKERIQDESAPVAFDDVKKPARARFKIAGSIVLGEQVLSGQFELTDPQRLSRFENRKGRLEVMLFDEEGGIYLEWNKDIVGSLQKLREAQNV